jgi:stringent starvation protein B
MTSNKPYLIRALYEWIADNGLTPYVLVNAALPGCRVPETHVTNGRIIFNIAFDVVKGLVLGNEIIEFTARFSGVPTPISIPTASILAIYTKENGEGMAFPEEPIPLGEEESEVRKKPKASPAKGKPNLTIVK